jgi:hypothetical protein
MFGRFGDDTYDSTYEFTASPGAGPLDNFHPGHQWSGHISNIISPTMVNEVVVGYGHDNFGFYRIGGDVDSNYFRTTSLNPPTLYPIPTGPQYETYLPSATYAGGALSNPGAFYANYTGNLPVNSGFPIPYKKFNDTYSFQDDLSKVFGSHTLKAGFYVEYNVKIEPNGGNNYSGVFNFGSSVNNPLDTGDGYANALLGIYQTYTQPSGRLVPYKYFWEDEGYVQDNWRISSRFTLDYGLRWYHMGILEDKQNYFSNFYPQLWNPA